MTKREIYDIFSEIYKSPSKMRELTNALLAKFEQEKKKAIEDVFYDINSDELRDNYWDYLDMQDKSVVSVEQMKIAAKIEAYEEVFEALKNLAKEYGVEL